MILAIDSCSIILLAKAMVLEELAKWRKIMITKEVFNEVLEGKDKKLLDALVLERLVKERIIIIKENINKKLIQKFKTDFGLGGGEAGSIALALESEDKAIITDNKQGRKAAKIQRLKLSGSIDVIMALYKLNKISKEKAIGALKVLKGQGWFQDYLIETALQEVQDG